MKWLDEAGDAGATAWAKRYCVTVDVDGIRFHRPMNVAMEVRGDDIKSGAMEKTTECIHPN